jgi:hypothetical protein
MFAFLARTFNLKQIFNACDRITQDAVGVIYFGAALQRQLTFLLGPVDEIVGVQLPVQLQKLLLDRRSLDSDFAWEVEQGEIVGALPALLQFAASRAKVSAEGPLVATPANQRGIGYRCKRRTHEIFFVVLIRAFRNLRNRRLTDPSIASSKHSWEMANTSKRSNITRLLGTKKSGWRVRLPTTCRISLLRAYNPAPAEAGAI